MTVSRISQTRQGRFALFDEEDEFLFSIDDETLVRNKVRVGAVFDEDALAALRAQSDLRKAKDKALDHLSVRDYASGELYDKLRQKFDGHTAAAAVAEVKRLGLLDDARFAAHRARYLAEHGKSPREIRGHLRAKGVDGEIIDDALDALDIDEVAVCRSVIEKSYLRKLEAGRKDLVTAALARKGFSYGVIKEALEEIEDS